MPVSSTGFVALFARDRVILCHMPFIANASPICNGIAGVNGPAQNAMIAPVAVQNQGLTMIANIAVTITGLQNINSAISR